MKRYNKNGQLETIMCNCCGKKLVVQHGIIREGCISIDHAWDYFSEKDGRAKIQVTEEQMALALEKRQEILAALRSDYTEVLLDLEVRHA